MRGEANGADAGEAIEQLVHATVASLQAPALDRPEASGPPTKLRANAGAALIVHRPLRSKY